MSRMEIDSSIKKLKKKQHLLLVIMIMILLLSCVSFAWYYFKDRKEADSADAAVMGPYYLYLKDENREELQLSVGSMHPGETKYAIIGVSSEPASSGILPYLVGKDTQFDYELELAYTENLPLDYKIYELKDEVAGGFQIKDLNGAYRDMGKEDTPLVMALESEEHTNENNKELYGPNVEDATDIINYVQYELYQKDTDGNSLHLTTEVDLLGQTNYDLDYYVIEMNWETGIEFHDFIKETDLIYVMVKAIQPEPVEE